MNETDIKKRANGFHQNVRAKGTKAWLHNSRNIFCIIKN